MRRPGRAKHPNLDLRVLHEKVLHERQNVKPSEHCGRRDIDPTARLDPLAQSHRFEFVIGGQQLPAAFEITRARISQRD
jgi:hypothetical protein